jgi:hypothetical protein
VIEKVNELMPKINPENLSITKLDTTRTSAQVGLEDILATINSDPDATITNIVSKIETIMDTMLDELRKNYIAQRGAVKYLERFRWFKYKLPQPPVTVVDTKSRTNSGTASAIAATRIARSAAHAAERAKKLLPTFPWPGGMATRKTIYGRRNKKKRYSYKKQKKRYTKKYRIRYHKYN